jgi:hypothetical protein
MPEPLWIYLMALLHFTKVSTYSTIAEAFAKASHDCLTRMLNGSWSGQTLLDVALRVLFQVVGGYLIVDDTVVEKPHAKRLNEAGWVWSSKRNKGLYGVSVVLLVWTDGQIRISLGYRVWKKGGPSKFELALESLSYARNRLKCKPQFVLFDSWYPSKVILSRIRDYGWYFVCRLKKNRGFEGVALHQYLHQLVKLRELQLHRPRQWGACWLACELWDQVALDAFWSDRLGCSRQGTRWLNVFKTLVCYQLIEPGSEWRLHREGFEQSARGICWGKSSPGCKKISSIAVSTSCWIINAISFPTDVGNSYSTHALIFCSMT